MRDGRAGEAAGCCSNRREARTARESVSGWLGMTPGRPLGHDPERAGRRIPADAHHGRIGIRRTRAVAAASDGRRAGGAMGAEMSGGRRIRMRRANGEIGRRREGEPATRRARGSVARRFFFGLFRKRRQNRQRRRAVGMPLVLHEDVLDAGRATEQSMHVGNQRRQHRKERQGRSCQMKVEPRSQRRRPLEPFD